jgi:hypothetical protein
MDDSLPTLPSVGGFLYFATLQLGQMYSKPPVFA